MTLIDIIIYKTKSKFIASLMLYYWISLTNAQECSQTLSGSVIDFHNGAPLKNATITYNNTTVTTDDDGKYYIEGLCPVFYAFTISHKNCNTRVVTVNLDVVSTEDFFLEHHLEELEEIKLAGDKTKTNSAQEETLNEEQISKFGSASLGDAIKEIPGVSSLNTGSSIVKPIIQGLNGSRITIINNGVRMQDMEWGEEHAPNLDLNTAGSITVVKGASALQYGGDAIGGTIILTPQKVPAKDTLFGNLSTYFRSNGRGNATTTSINKGFKTGWFLKAQGTIKRFGDFETPDYILSNTGSAEKAASISFGVNKFEYGWDAYYSFFDNQIGILRGAHIGNVEDLINSINRATPAFVQDFTYNIDNPRQDVNHHLARLKYFRRFEKLGKWNFQYDFQKNHRLEFDRRRTQQLSKLPSIDLELKTHTISTDFIFDAKSNYKINAGLMARYQDNFASPEGGVRRLIPDYEKVDAAGFIISEIDLSDQLILDAGIRYDYNHIDAQKFYRNSTWEDRGYDIEFPEFEVSDARGAQILTNPVFEYHNISASVGLKYEFDQYQLRANYALAQRAPNPAELFSDGLHHSAARIETGDLSIEQETSQKVGVSFQKNGKFWRLEIAPYANLINNYMLLEPTDVILSIRGAFPVWEYRASDSRFLGLDTKTNFNWTANWSTNHSFSIVKGQERKDNTPLINIPAPILKNRISFTKENLNVTLESEYNFRQNEHPPNITVFSSEQQIQVPLEINTPTDAYHLINLNANYNIDVWKKNTLKLGLDIHNVLNKTYRNYLNRLRYFSDDLGRNITLRLSINY